MKEASGELSMTAIAVVAIGAIALVFATLIFPAIRDAINNQTRCAAAVNCQPCAAGQRDTTCQWWNEANDRFVDVQCGCPAN